MYHGFQSVGQIHPEPESIESLPVGGKFKIPKECDNFAKGVGPPPRTRMKMEKNVQGPDGKPRNIAILEGEQAGTMEQIPPEIRVYRT